jgi:hypothetical protein
VAGRVGGGSYSFRLDYAKSATPPGWLGRRASRQKKSPRLSPRGPKLESGESSRAPQRTVRLQLPRTQPLRALIWINLNVRSSATRTTSLRPLPAADLHRVIHRDVQRCGDKRSPTTGARGARIVRRPGGRRRWRCGRKLPMTGLGRPERRPARCASNWRRRSNRPNVRKVGLRTSARTCSTPKAGYVARRRAGRRLKVALLRPRMPPNRPTPKSRPRRIVRMRRGGQRQQPGRCAVCWRVCRRRCGGNERKQHSGKLI